jgi:hypothetical protein
MCKTMEVRAHNVWREVKKKHQLPHENGLDKIRLDKIEEN